MLDDDDDDDENRGFRCNWPIGKQSSVWVEKVKLRTNISLQRWWWHPFGGTAGLWALFSFPSFSQPSFLIWSHFPVAIFITWLLTGPNRRMSVFEHYTQTHTQNKIQLWLVPGSISGWNRHFDLCCASFNSLARFKRPLMTFCFVDTMCSSKVWKRICVEQSWAAPCEFSEPFKEKFRFRNCVIKTNKLELWRYGLDSLVTPHG